MLPYDKDPKPLAFNYVRDSLISFHAYQFLLYISRFYPSAISLVARAMFKLKFSNPIHVIDTSYKVFNFDCLFPQYTNEWAVPLERATEAIGKLIARTEESGLSAHSPVEIRFVGQDDVWLSPAYERNCCYIGIIMYR